MGEMIVAHDISHGLKANQQIWADGLRRWVTKKRGERCPGATTAIASGEQTVLPRDRLGPDCALDNGGVDLDATIGQEPLQRLTPGEPIADRLGGFGFAGDFTQFALPQVEEIGDGGRGPFLPPRGPGLSISTTHLILDLPQRTHGDDRIRSDLRDPGNVQVVELSPQMRPEPGKLDRVIAASLGARLGKARIGGISVDLKDTVEPGEMTCHALAASAVLEAIGHHRRAGPP